MNRNDENVYLQQALQKIPQILALFDRNKYSPTYGIGDRTYWAWKTIDFPNGTFQGAAHGLARLLNAGLVPNSYSPQKILERIDGIFHGARRITRSNGSLEEAMPNESSFCVTALVAFDLLSALELLQELLEEKQSNRYEGIVAPMIRFILEADETHAFISNHLATAAAALFRWNRRTGCKKSARKGNILLNRIIQKQSSEGWFREYEGADPGYETLALYYLADIALLQPANVRLREALYKSVAFLENFAHPDGSFGGLYGSRNTRFIVPAGIEAIASIFPRALHLAKFIRRSIHSECCVTLATIDPPNLIPIWNAYCWASVLLSKNAISEVPRGLLPFEMSDTAAENFPEAGLFIRNTSEYYQIISYHKGGAFYHYDKKVRHTTLSGGIVATDARGRYYSSQSYDTSGRIEVHNGTVSVISGLTEIHNEVPMPWQFVCVRLASITLLRLKLFNQIIKKALVYYLITRKKKCNIYARRDITCGPQLAIRDSLLSEESGVSICEKSTAFSAIHMASQGYWQIGDDSGTQEYR